MDTINDAKYLFCLRLQSWDLDLHLQTIAHG